MQVCQLRSGLTSLSFFFPIPLLWPSSVSSLPSPFSNPFSARSPESLLLSFSLLTLTVGNIYFHLLCSPFGHLLDAGGMLVALSPPLSLSIARLRHYPVSPPPRASFWLHYAFLFATLTLSYNTAGELLTLMFVGFAYAFTETKRAAQRGGKMDPHVIVGGCWFLTALMLLLDPRTMRKEFMGTLILRWGHSGWHIFCGVAIWAGMKGMGDGGEEGWGLVGGGKGEEEDGKLEIEMEKEMEEGGVEMSTIVVIESV